MSLQELEARLRIEKAIMSNEMPQFKLYYNNDLRFFEGWHES
jgi:hypothetical protein